MKKGQLSAEMLILIAVVLAIVAIVAMQLLSTGQQTSEKIDQKSKDILDTTDKYSLRESGSACDYNAQCKSAQCISGICK